MSRLRQEFIQLRSTLACATREGPGENERPLILVRAFPWSLFERQLLRLCVIAID